MTRTISCFTNCFGAAGVWSAVERIRETGIDHLELALRGHNFGGVVIPESAVITEQAADHEVDGSRGIWPGMGSRSVAATSAVPTFETNDGVELTEGRLRFAALVRCRRLCFRARANRQIGRRRTIVEHLRRLGNTAGECGITLAQTHKGPTQNAEAMLCLMNDVDHRQIRLNFDTGNIAYYNSGVDPCDELDKVKHLVRNVHLKDNHGGFEEWYFPALGDGGSVDFVRVRAILDGVGFAGPYTIEIEGIGGEPEPGLEARQQRVTRSVRHLRDCGYFD